MTDEKTHYLAIWTVADPRQVPPRVCETDVGELMLFATQELADVFADQLRAYGLLVAVRKVSSQDVAELLAYNLEDRDAALAAAERAVVVEAQATGRADARKWAIDLADRFMTRLVRDLKSPRDDEAERSTACG